MPSSISSRSTPKRSKRISSLTHGATLGATLVLAAIQASGDEGMWLYNDPPRKLLAERYGFDPTDAWLEHLQKSSIRFNSGGSGSFVSADGLIITNHHVGADDLQKLSDAEHDYLRDGFHARTAAEEKRCLDLELNVLMEIENVTARVKAAVKSGLSDDAAFAARRAAMAEIENESLQKTGFRSDVVPLYEGAEYHLYRYKRYTDVRLVFAPEAQAAFFGGDPDNFEYPRHDLDICLFRAYENGRPARVPHHLAWSARGVSENELIFVSGHPGGTSRQLTVAELEYVRDRQLPTHLTQAYRKELMLTAWSARSDENARRAKESLFGVQNWRKASEGMMAGLLDPALMAAKRREERQLRAAVAAKTEWKETLTAWDRIQAAQQILAKNAKDESLLEHGRGFDSHLFHLGRTLLRSAEEKARPSGERLREYRDSNRESLELELFSTEPIYTDFETVKLADSLTWLAVELGAESPLVQQVLAGKAPRERAAELVGGTKLADVAFRKKLYAGSAAEVTSAHDPMIELAYTIDPEARRLRKISETQLEVKRQAYAAIGAARFALKQGTTYPDATFTLRLAFGTARGYEQEGAAIPFQTTLAGLYERAAAHHDRPPFNLAARWTERKSGLDLATPFNFVSTADIIGGNSGSPVVNRAGQFVGIIFDGNIQSLAADYQYTDQQARAVSVSSQAIIEALRKVYDAPELAEELLTGKGR